MLLAKPGFALAAILTLALGIGANALVFALIDGVYMRDLPYRQSSELVDVYSSMAMFGGGYDTVSVPDYVDIHAQVPALEDSALYTGASFNMAEGGTPERLQGARVTPSLFSTLGVGAASGRVFGADDAVVGRDRVVVLSDALWRNRFDADPNILARSLRLDGESYRVVGVMPPGFMFPRVDVGLFVPYSFAPSQLADDQRGVNDSQIVARLAPGATTDQVDAQIAAVVQHNIERTAGKDGDSYAHWVKESGLRFGARPLRDQLSGRNADELFLLQGACALVLLIALANVANLLLTRLSSRRSELAMRNALGARRSDVARQLIVEALLLAVTGAVAGLVLASFGLRIVAASGLLPAWAHFAIDLRTIAFTLGLAVTACVLFGLTPAFVSARVSTQGTLRESARSQGGGRTAKRVRATLVVVQLALAVALLAGAGLLLRSFANATQQNPGFDGNDVLTAHLTLSKTSYRDDAARARGLRNMLDALRALPGVEKAGATTKLPFSGENGGVTFRVVGRADDGSIPNAALRSVDENFFATLKIPALRGRTFEAADWNSPALGVVVDETFANRFFPNGDGVGQRITHRRRVRSRA